MRGQTLGQTPGQGFGLRSGQRGYFAMMAIVLLLVVVALALRLLLSATQGATHAGLMMHESLRAAMLAESGVEQAIARLQAGPNKNDTRDCAADWLGIELRTPVSDGSHQLSAVSLAERAVPPSCDTDRSAPVCRITISASAGAAARVQQADIGRCIDPLPESGLSGTGGAADNPIRYSVTARSSPAITLLNIGYKRQDPGGNAVAGECRNLGTGSLCQSVWDVETSSGNPSVGAIAQVDSSTIVGNFGVTQQLKKDSGSQTVNRVFVAVGGIFEGSAITYVGQYHGASTMTNSGAVSGTIPHFSVGGWCNAADTLVFNISAGATSAGQALNAVRVGSPGNTVSMTLLQRYTNPAAGNGIYSEIWYVHRPLAQGGVAGLFSGTAADLTPFTVFPNHEVSNWQWAGGFLCLSGVDPGSIRGTGHGWQPLYGWSPS